MTYSNLCSIHLFCGDIINARKFLEKSNLLIKKSPIKFWIGQNIYLEAKINIFNRHFNKAEKLFKETWNIFYEINSPKKKADLICEMINLYSLLNDAKKINNTLEYINSLPKVLNQLEKERMFVAKLYAQLFFGNKRKLVDPDELENLDNCKWDNKFEIFSNLTKYYKYVDVDKIKEVHFFNKSLDFYDNFLKIAPNELVPYIKKHPMYNVFFSEFGMRKKDS